jgi:hypothetical protein
MVVLEVGALTLQARLAEQAQQVVIMAAQGTLLVETVVVEVRVL